MKDLKKEVTQVKGLSVETLQLLANLKDSKFYSPLRSLLKMMSYDAMWNITKIPSENPNLAVKKAKYDGIMEATRTIDNKIRKAKEELEKAIKKEKKGKK